MIKYSYEQLLICFVYKCIAESIGRLEHTMKHHHHDHEEHEYHCSCGHDHSHEEHHHHDHEAHEHHHHTPVSHGQTIYILENLGCAHCAAKMEEKINALPGVDSAVIVYATKQLRLSAKHPEQLLPEIQRICASIESQVKVTEPPKKSAGTASKDHVHDHDHIHSDHADNHKEEQMDLLQIIAGAVLFLAGVLLEKTGFSETASIVLFVLAYLILGGKILLEAARNISHGQVFDENFLMGIATLGAFGIQEYPEAVGVMLFYRIGEYFEHKAVEQSRSQIMEAIDLRPEVVNLVQGNSIQVIPAEEASIGDILLIRPGDRIPLDGTVIEGESRLDTSPITGEPVPVAISAGSEVLSGCINTSGQLKLRVDKLLQDSMVTRILNSVENAAASKPKLDRFITRFSRIYTPCVVFGALAIAVIPSVFTGNWRYWVYTALTFLVMSCPCALVLSVPLAFFSGIGLGSKKKILFKGGLSIEALNNVKAVVMDKTGTITEGNFRLQNLFPEGSLSEEELLRICASCEQNSSHPIAHSIVAAAQERGIQLDAPSTLKEIAGHGISAQMSQGQILCGNQKLMDLHHISIPQTLESSGAEVFVAINGIYAGCLLISDTIKSDASDAISRLNTMGLHTVMLTGDSEASANVVAGKTGIHEVHAKLLPQDKLSILQQIRSKKGSVLFVGDGINDAPVLAGADVGAAMGSGADAAIEAADAVFMNTSVNAIPDAIQIARRTYRIAIQNVVFALAIKLTVMILGLLGFANMWMAVFADSGVAMLCVLNSIRILYKK